MKKEIHSNFPHSQSGINFGIRCSFPASSSAIKQRITLAKGEKTVEFILFVKFSVNVLLSQLVKILVT